MRSRASMARLDSSTPAQEEEGEKVMALEL